MSLQVPLSFSAPAGDLRIAGHASHDPIRPVHCSALNVVARAAHFRSTPFYQPKETDHEET